jgi:hypothetical protein
MRARASIELLDRGGVSLRPVIVDGVVRVLGLDVGRHAPIEQTSNRM